MSKVSLGGSPTGTATFDIVAPATNTNRTITLPDSSGQVSVLDLRTAVTASGTAIDFTNIPATARRITVMFSGVSTNGTSNIVLRLGTSSGVESFNYFGATTSMGVSTSTVNNTAHFQVASVSATSSIRGHCSIVLLDQSANTWANMGAFSNSAAAEQYLSSGSKSLSGTLDRIRITTVNGTDIFDAGTINILVE